MKEAEEVAEQLNDAVIDVNLDKPSQQKIESQKAPVPLRESKAQYRNLKQLLTDMKESSLKP